MGHLKGSFLSSQHPKAGRKGADSKPECFSLQTAHLRSVSVGATSLSPVLSLEHQRNPLTNQATEVWQGHQQGMMLEE